MAHVFYIKNNIFTVSSCTQEDIEVHYNVVKNKVQDTDKEIYINRMQLSVDQGRAYKINNDAFIYLYTENSKWYGASIFSNKVILLVMLMVTTSELFNYRKIEFTPHIGMIECMKSMIDGSSIRSFRTSGKNVVIRIPDLMDKFTKLFECIGVKYECCS